MYGDPRIVIEFRMPQGIVPTWYTMGVMAHTLCDGTNLSVANKPEVSFTHQKMRFIVKLTFIMRDNYDHKKFTDNKRIIIHGLLDKDSNIYKSFDKDSKGFTEDPRSE